MQLTDKLVAWARQYKMSSAEIRAQRRSFAYGNCHLDNERVTREMVDEADERVFPEKVQLTQQEWEDLDWALSATIEEFGQYEGRQQLVVRIERLNVLRARLKEQYQGEANHD